MDNEVFSLSVQFLTGSFVDFDFNKKTSGDELLARCKEFHGISQYKNFGLQLHSGVWLAKEKTIERQLRREYGSLRNSQFSVKLRIRFWPRNMDKCKTSDLQTYLFLQLKSDIANERLIVTESEREAILVKMGALQQQVDYGDTSGENHLFTDKTFVSKANNYHRKYRGMGRNEAREKFLALGQQLTYYGVETFPVQMNNVNYYLGIHCQGYYLWNSDEYKTAKCGRYFKWNKIKEFRYRDKNFFIKFKKNADIPHQTFQFASFTKARSLFSSMMDYHIFYRVKPEKDTPQPRALKNETSDFRVKSGTNLSKTPAGSQEYLLEIKENAVQVDAYQKDHLRFPRLGVSHQIISPDLANSTFETDPFTPLTSLSNAPLPDNVGKNQWEYTITPKSRGDFGLQFYGGIDQGLNPTITNADHGLLPGDILLSVNGVPVQEHTYNQIKESIQSSVVLDRLNVVVYRESKSFEESLEAVREGLLSGSLLRQFEQIPTLRVDLSRATSLRRGNEAKNRYRDVLPYDDTRVKLSNNSYINASWIDIHTGNFHRQWIAAQGPLENTICDFWRCIWETDVTSIIMLCKVVECMQDKCAQYWPTELFIAEEYDRDFHVVMEEEEFLEYAVKRVFILCHSSGKSRKVVHWQYTDWPDHGVPDNPDDFLNFFHNVRLQLSPPEPVFVHCSAGVGRTGVTIALDSCMAMIEQRISVNPINIVRKIRNQRCMMIQNSAQFEMLLKLIAYIAHAESQP